MELKCKDCKKGFDQLDLWLERNQQTIYSFVLMTSKCADKYSPSDETKWTIKGVIMKSLNSTRFPSVAGLLNSKFIILVLQQFYCFVFKPFKRQMF